MAHTAEWLHRFDVIAHDINGNPDPMMILVGDKKPQCFVCIIYVDTTNVYCDSAFNP